MKLYPSEINNFTGTLTCNVRDDAGALVVQLRTTGASGLLGIEVKGEFEKLASLLISAPDLLEALQDVLATTAWNRIGNDALHKALAVIERVTGEAYNPTETE